ncbi:MAG: 3-isopropylmalate dehydratase small subunit [Bacteriovoracaceae bacterium]|nr:3-isopropylmalate dehydratase small subunit [Bacteriovoracaceae bacterium]
MEPFSKLAGIIAPIDRSNVDTDQIIPKQFLKKVGRQGFGKHLFHNWRFLDDNGEKINPDFILNKPEYNGVQMLVARENFGSGSSREHAAWALADYGLKVVIAPSFADIFFNNCFNNGILPVRLKSAEIDALFEKALQCEEITVDLPAQTVTTQDKLSFSFQIDSFNKECLLKGINNIGWTLQFMTMIEEYEQLLNNNRPWNQVKKEGDCK